MRARVRRQVDRLLWNLRYAEDRGDAQAEQEAYEELFTVCRKHQLDLATVMRQPRNNSLLVGILSALKALWPMA